MIKIRFLYVVLIGLFSISHSHSQYVALKTNVVHGATLTPNLAVEIGLNPTTTLDIYGGWNPFTFNDNKKVMHWIVQPELRWWLCDRFNGAFFGLHLHGGQYNTGGVGPFTIIRDHRYEGHFYGGGISYGYQWMLSNRWGLELEIGGGYTRIEYDRFGCRECSPKEKSGSYNYFGPTKALISFMLFLW